MCLAIPGKVVSVKDGKAVIDYTTEKREVIAKGVTVQPGDYVLVQFGMVIEKLPEQEAKRAIKNWKELNSQTR